MDSEEWKMLKQAAIRFELKTGEYAFLEKFRSFQKNRPISTFWLNFLGLHVNLSASRQGRTMFEYSSDRKSARYSTLILLLDMGDVKKPGPYVIEG